MIAQNAPVVDDNPYLREPAVEEVAQESVFLFRLPLDEARRLIPSHLTPLVVAPDTTLFGIGIQRIPRTRFCPITDIAKVYLVHAVHPRYDLGTATPRFCFYVPTIYVSPPAFRDEIRRIDKVEPFEGRGLRIGTDASARTITVEDDAGPICALRHTTPPPAFRRLGMWNQVRSMYRGSPYVQTTYWEGEGYEHSGTAEVGEIHQHPLFGDLAVTGLAARAYHQLFMRTGSQAVVFMYAPVAEPPEPASTRSR